MLFAPCLIKCLAPVQSIHPFVEVVEHLRRELAWGLAPVKPLRSAPGTPDRSPLVAGTVPGTPRSPGSAAASIHEYFARPYQALPFVSVIEPPALELATAILEAMDTVQRLITLTFENPYASVVSSSKHSQEDLHAVSGSHKAAVRAAERKLAAARDSMREVLRHVFDQVDMQQRAEGKKAHLPKEIFDCSLAAIALLQVRPSTGPRGGTGVMCDFIETRLTVDVLHGIPAVGAVIHAHMYR